MVSNPKNEDLFLWSFYLLNKSLSHLPTYYPKLKEEMKPEQTIGIAFAIFYAPNNNLLQCLFFLDLPSKRQSTILKLFRSALEEDSLIDQIDTKTCNFLVQLLIDCFNFERQRTQNDVCSYFSYSVFRVQSFLNITW